MIEAFIRDLSALGRHLWPNMLFGGENVLIRKLS